MSQLDIFTPRRAAQLLAIDWTNTRRDPTLLFVFLFSAVPALALWYFRAPLDGFGTDALGWSDLSHKLIPMVLTLPPLMQGWVVGFLFLEERDDGPLQAIAITGVGQEGMLAYRMALAWSLSAALTVMGVVLVLPDAGILTLLILSLNVGLEAVLITILLPALARNKVEGLALTKVFNIAAIIALVPLIASPFKLIAGIVPSFWIGEAILRDTAVTPLWLALLLGTAVHIGAVFVALRLTPRGH